MLLYEPLFRALNASGTRYVVVGGVATADLIFLKRPADRPRDRDDIEKLETIARLKGILDEPREDT